MDQDNQPAANTQPQPQTPQNPQPSPQAPAGENPGQLFGILSIVMIFVFQPLGIVFGYLSRKKSKEANMPTGLGTAGLVINSILVGIGLIVVVFTIIILALAGSSGNVDVETSTGTPGYDSSLSE